MLAIHPQARTTPAVRAEIARSPESSGVLAKRYGVSAETIRKWRKRGPERRSGSSERLRSALRPNCDPGARMLGTRIKFRV
jgi:transposase-like protein